MSGIYLTVTVDTEEEGLWGNKYFRKGYPVQNIGGIARFQKLCDEFDIKPTYFIDYSVAKTESARDIFLPIHLEGRGEIAGHLHSWSTPPYEEELTNANSLLFNLPEGLIDKKIKAMLEAHRERFGFRPVSFRAGRWAFDEKICGLLIKNGFEVDSSIHPFMDMRSQGLEIFSKEPPDCYWLDPKDIRNMNAHISSLLEIPVSAGFNFKNFNLALKIFYWIQDSFLSKFRIINILSYLNLLRLITLGPEIVKLSRMIQLTNVLRAKSRKVLNVYIHSSSLMSGHNPYVKNEAALSAFLEKIRDFFRYATQVLGTKGVTLIQIKKIFEKGEI